MIDQLLRQIEAQIRRGQWLAVEALCRQVLELNPHDAASWHHLSIAQFEQGRRGDAEASEQRAITENASQSAFWLHLGNILFQDERFAEAADAYRKSLALEPRDPIAWSCLGSAEHVQKHPAEARAAYEASLSLVPTQWETRLKLALLLDGDWSLAEAESQAARVVTDDPARAEGWSMLGRIRLAQGRQTEAFDALARSANLMPIAGAYSRLLQCRQYLDDVTPAPLLEAHKQWAAAFASNIPPIPTTAGLSLKSDRPLRLGFVSGEFGKSPIGHLALPLLENLDKSQCSIACYFDCRGPEDDLTARFRAVADTWHVSHGQSDEALAEQIARDEIDVLFDLMGHVGNRLLVHARRPASLQITWLGYVGTTGLAAMDGLLADRFHVRTGEETHYVESVLRMPNGYVCYGPPRDAPPVGPLPALTNGYMTFGCFNNPSKYSPRTLDAFAQVLQRAPNSRLLLRYGGLDEPASQSRLRDEFARRGVEPERILFAGWSPHPELLAAYNDVDLALDTQPYSGGLTTCEALWMGVPTITYPGLTFAGRHSTSHLTNAGCGQFVARDVNDYVELAAGWANRFEELAAIRGSMREQVRRSPLCDAQQFAADFLALIRRAWQSKQIAAWNTHGLRHAQRGDHSAACASFRRALAFSLQQVAIQYNLALALSFQGELDEAETLVRQLLRAEPTYAAAWSLLGVILNKQLRQGEAMTALARSIELEPNPNTHGLLLLEQQYLDDVSPAGLLAAHRQWDAQHAAPLLPTAPAATKPRSAGERLRIGFVSADFRLHPVGFLSFAAVKHLDRAQCSVVCYSDRLTEDPLTALFRQAAGVWRPIAGRSDHEVAEQVRADGIDVLIDLAGHAGTRLLVFARKPAPIQVTWLGYVGTTGMAAMDFLLADRFHVPAGEEPHYVESVLRMPHGYACYTPPDDAPEVAALPALGDSPFTFGCFNNPAKFSPRMLDAWAEILRRTPTARLLLKHTGLDQAQIQQLIRGHFTGRGVDPSRILLEGRSPLREFLAAYAHVDLALDTQPYSGGLTTCEALWMGVPVVTYPGATFAGRHSTSHLSNAGCEQFVARDLAEYIELAVGWANRAAELAALRSNLREQVRASHLCNAAEFAREFFSVLSKARAQSG